MRGSPRSVGHRANREGVSILYRTQADDKLGLGVEHVLGMHGALSAITSFKY